MPGLSSCAPGMGIDLEVEVLRELVTASEVKRRASNREAGVKEAWSAIACRANPRALRGSQPSRIRATGGVPVGTLASGLPD
jgi:hypothetical protein